MAHMTRHELKHDEMEDIGARIAEWYENNQKIISTLLIVLIVGVVGYRLYNYYNDQQTAKASSEIGVALQNYNNALNQSDAAKRKELLNTAVADAQRISTQYGNDPAGRTALLVLANAKYYLAVATAGTPEHKTLMEEARGVFDKYISAAVTDEESAAGYLGRGNVLENMAFAANDVQLAQQAMDDYEQARKKLPGSYIAADATLSKARLLQAQEGRQQDAAALYQEIIKDRTVTIPQKDEKTESSEASEAAELPGALPEEKIAEITSFRNLSYAHEAQQALDRLPGLPKSSKEAGAK